MGTPELARTVLVSLARAPWARLLAVACQPDRPSGRHLHPTPPPVKVEALQRNWTVLQPARAREPEFLSLLRELAPDLIIVAAYGQLLPAPLLEIPRFGCLNVHTSLLPRWRGAAPIQWAIASGDAETGVTLMKMDPGLDTGPVLGEIRTPIFPEDTSQSVHDRLAELGGELVCSLVPEYVKGHLQPRPQPAEGVTLARKITREDGRMDWTQPADLLHRRFRAFTPWPGSHCFLSGSDRPRLMKIHAARCLDGDPVPNGGAPGELLSAGSGRLVVRCGRGALELLEVQLEGGRRLKVAEFLAGHTLSRLE